MNNIATTNKLLLFIVIPLVLYILHLLSFIFIPLFGALLIAMLCMPLLRKLTKRNVPKYLSIVIVTSVITIIVVLIFYVLKISILEVASADASFWKKIVENFNSTLIPVMELLGVDQVAGEDSLRTILHSDAISEAITNNAGVILGLANRSITMFLMAVFFLILLISGSMNMQQVLEDTIFKKRHPSLKTFLILEKSIVKFIVVKFLISLGTGIGFSIACYYFDIRFPVFWGFIAFSFNFIQMVGSIVSTAIVAVFAMAQLNGGEGLIPFIISCAGTQVIFGSILEPIFMGKTFSINTITILVMLMMWGFLWGVPGLILSIPITVAVKTIMHQTDGTKILARIMS